MACRRRSPTCRSASAARRLSAKLLAELPAVLVAYDLLEEGGVDLREVPQHERRTLLEALVTESGQEQLKLSPLVEAEGWDAAGRNPHRVARARRRRA